MRVISISKMTLIKVHSDPFVSVIRQDFYHEPTQSFNIEAG